MISRIAIVTNNLENTIPFLNTNAPRLDAIGIEVPVVLLTRRRQNRRFPERVLRKARVQSKIMGISLGSQIINIAIYTMYNMLIQKNDCILRPEERLSKPINTIVVESANCDDFLNVVKRYHCDLVLLMGSDVLKRATLDALAVPVLNCHLSDPQFVRGLPPVFWEILDHRETICLTVHSVTPAVDSGPVLAQREYPIQWGPGVSATIQMTYKGAMSEVGELHELVIRQLVAGMAKYSPSIPGPLRSTPNLLSILKAERICRLRYKKLGKCSS